MLRITEEATLWLRPLLAEQGAGAALRLLVGGGGCSGFSYGAAITQEGPEDGDVVEEPADGVRVLIDPFSFQHLDGAEIDYQDSLLGGGMLIHNPNAVRTCSCGHSFAAAGGGGEARPCGG